MSKTYGVAIIGAGVIFRDHARAYTQLSGRAKMIGLADVDGSRARSATEQFFIPHFTTDYRELLAREDVDVVDICTPPSLHEEMVTAALEAGKHVVCEKPLAHTLSACDRIVGQAAERFPGRLSTVHQLRYSPEAQRAVWCRDQGLLGQLCFARFSRYAGLENVLQQKGWWGKWDVAGGGAVMTQCIHELDLMLHFMGPARRVTASMATLAHDIESEDTFSATIEFDKGMGTCYCTLAGNLRYTVEWEVVGTAASVQFPWRINTRDRNLAAQIVREVAQRFPGARRPTGIAAKVLGRVRRKLSRRASAAVPSQHTGYLRAVLDAIDAGGPLPVGPTEARRDVELCTAIYESAILQRPVELPLSAASRFYEGVTTTDYNGRRQVAQAR